MEEGTAFARATAFRRRRIFRRARRCCGKPDTVSSNRKKTCARDEVENQRRRCRWERNSAFRAELRDFRSAIEFQRLRRSPGTLSLGLFSWFFLFQPRRIPGVVGKKMQIRTWVLYGIPNRFDLVSCSNEDRSRWGMFIVFSDRWEIFWNVKELC